MRAKVEENSIKKNGKDLKKMKIEGDPKQVADIMQGLIDKYGKECFEICSSYWFVLHPELVIKNLNVGGHKQYRSVAKMAFNYLGYLGVNGVHSLNVSIDGQFDPIRSYIRYGDNEVISFPCHLDKRNDFEFSNLATYSKIEDAVFNQITIYCNPEHSNIIAYLTILGSLTFSTLLSSKFTGERRAFRFREYPLKKGSTKQQELSQYPSLPTTEELIQWPSFEDSYQLFAKEISRLTDLSCQRDEDEFMRNCIRDTFQELELKELTSDNPEEIKRFVKLLVDKLYEGKFGPQKQLRKKFTNLDGFLDYFQENS